MDAVFSRRRFTVDDFHRIGEAGILDGRERVELLDGQIIEMAPIGSRHAACVTGIPEAWLVDLPNRRTEVFCNPSPEFGYPESASLAGGASVESISVTGLSLEVCDVLG